MKKPEFTKRTAYRWIIYLLGMVILAIGISATTEAALGVSPIISVPYTITTLFDLNYGNMVFIYYCFLIALQYLLRLKNSRLSDLLQIIVSLIFSRFLNLFTALIDTPDPIWARVLLIIGGVILTGIGLSMTVVMDLVPNPGDGIVMALSWRIKKPMGFCKNIIDFSSVGATFIIGICTGHFLLGIGVGTVIAMVLTGRVVAVWNHFTQKKLMAIAGLSADRLQKKN